MLHEALDELLPGDANHALGAVVIGAHAQLHLPGLDAKDALVGDRGAVRVTRQILQDLRRSAHRGLGVDHPAMGQERTAPLAPAARLWITVEPGTRPIHRL